MLAKWQTMFECIDNQEVGLEAAILERVRNSSLVKWSGADNVTGLKHGAEATDFIFGWSGRGAFPSRRSGGGSQPWSPGK